MRDEAFGQRGEFHRCLKLRTISKTPQTGRCIQPLIMGRDAWEKRLRFSRDPQVALILNGDKAHARATATLLRCSTAAEGNTDTGPSSAGARSAPRAGRTAAKLPKRRLGPKPAPSPGPSARLTG